MKFLTNLLRLNIFLIFGVLNAQSTPFWQSKIEVNESSDGTIVSTSDASYASSAYSIDSIPGNSDGYFEFTVNNLYGMVGLTSDPKGTGFATIDYCFQLWASTTLNIMENSVTVWRGTSGSWTKGDKLKIHKSGNVVKYYKNGVLLHTSTLLTSPTSNYFADFAFGGANSGFDKPVIAWTKPVATKSFWQSKIEVNESSDGTIVSTSDASYASSAYSIDSIPGNSDGYFEFTVNNLYGMVGLTSDPKGTGFATIDYCFQLWASTTLNIMENSVTVWRGTSGSWTKGDKLKIQKSGNVVKYYKNGVLLHTSTLLTSPTSNYFADFAFGGANSGFDKPVIFVSNVVTSVEENQIGNENLIYPNPASGSINIAEDFEGTIEILNSNGILLGTILKEKGAKNFPLNLNSGVYLVNFIGLRDKKTLKLVIE